MLGRTIYNVKQVLCGGKISVGFGVVVYTSVTRVGLYHDRLFAYSMIIAINNLCHA